MCRMCKTLPGFRKRVRTTFFMIGSFHFGNTTPFKSFQLPFCPQSLQFPNLYVFCWLFKLGLLCLDQTWYWQVCLLCSNMYLVGQQMPIEHTTGYAASIGIDRGSHRRDAIPVESGIWNKNSVLGIYSICAAMAQKYHHEKPR